MFDEYGSRSFSTSPSLAAGATANRCSCGFASQTALKAPRIASKQRQSVQVEKVCVVVYPFTLVFAFIHRRRVGTFPAIRKVGAQSLIARLQPRGGSSSYSRKS